ncbi:hypothetical protein [Roseiflexus castenholzii]|uniref:hypothetical protein n=1 Tax=Roseiflexus castenholzii TaxID=120962 RepID=UPI003C7DA524
MNSLIGTVFLVLVVLVLPGLALILRMAPTAGETALERLTLAIGASLSLIPLLYLWLTWAGIAVRPPMVHLGLVVFLVTALISLHRIPIMAPLLTLDGSIWHLLIAGASVLTFWLRFEQIRDLVLPVWVDSVHHALLIRVSIEQGAAPLSLRPYLPVDGLTYHWGYHVFVATLAQAGGIYAPEALSQLMIWSGQVISALMVPAYAALALRLWQRPIAGAVAGLVVGLASVMPAYYVSWGRYTLLTGMLVLPAALLALDAVRRHPGPRSTALLALLLAGLSLVHFVVFALTLAACATLLVITTDHTSWRRIAIWLGIALTGALTITAPWIVLLASRILPGTGSSAMHVTGNAAYNALPLELLWAGTNRILLALGGTGALLSLWQRRRAAAWLIIWCAAAVLLANPLVIGLPYLSFITNEMLTITMFAPLALLIAGGAAAIDAWASPSGWRYGVWRLSAVALAVAVMLWGTNQWRTIVRPDTVLAGPMDLAAIEWAARATPPDARFVVGTAGWLYDVDRGADGGWWLLPLAGRQVSTPPVIYNYGVPDDVAIIKRDTSWLRDHGAAANAGELAAFMRERGYGYVYASERPGALRPEALRNASLFECVYDKGGVAIFRLRVPGTRDEGRGTSGGG